MKTPDLSARFSRLYGKPLPIMVVATLFVVLVCLSLIALDGWRTWQARDIELHESQVVASNLTRSLAQHAEDMISNADATLVDMVDRLEANGNGPAERTRLYSLLSTEVGESPWLHGLFIYDEQGRWLVNSETSQAQDLNNADREYFQYHRIHTNRGPHIGAALRSRSTGDWILPVSRRINHRDGSFAGVALASISVDYLQKFYGGFDIGKQGAIVLLLDNGLILVRHPFSEASIGVSIAGSPFFQHYLNKLLVGSATETSIIDGVERINRFQRVGHYPVIIDVGLSSDEILKKWETEAFWHSFGVSILVLVLGVLGYRMIGQIRLRLKVQEQLSESEKRLRTITDTMPAFIAYIDRDRNYRFCNASYLTAFNLTMEQLLSSNMRDLFGPEAYATIEPYVIQALAGNKVSFERPAKERGPNCYSLYHYVPDLDQSGKVRGFYAMVLDISPRKIAELKLAGKEKLLRGLTDHLPALVSYIDRDECFQFNNRPYEKWLDKPLSEITGYHFREACGDDTYHKHKNFLHAALIGNKTDFSFAMGRGDDTHYYNAAYIPQFDEQGEVAGVCSMINDITDLKKVELQLIKLARIDSLTGLPNRVQFDESLRATIARSRRSGLKMVLMYLDIDRFKSINDTYGHHAGDEALREFARRLGKSIRKTDMVARLSGDEFVIILAEIKKEDEVEIIAKKIIHAMEEKFTIDGKQLQVTTSIGMAVLNDQDTDPQSLLHRADVALYQVKSRGRNGFMTVNA